MEALRMGIESQIVRGVVTLYLWKKLKVSAMKNKNWYLGKVGHLVWRQLYELLCLYSWSLLSAA